MAKPRKKEYSGNLRKRKATYDFRKQPARRKDNMANVHVIMVLAYFISSLLILNYFRYAEMDLLQLVKLICLFLGISFLVPLSLYRKWLTMSFYEYIILNLIALAPVLCALFFSLNAGFKGPEYEERYRIVLVERMEGKTVYTLDDNIYQDKDYLRTINDQDEYEKAGIDSLGITFSDGWLGVRIVEEKNLY